MSENSVPPIFSPEDVEAIKRLWREAERWMRKCGTVAGGECGKCRCSFRVAVETAEPIVERMGA